MVSVVITGCPQNINVQPMVTNNSCKLTQIIVNLSLALNAHKHLKLAWAWTEFRSIFQIKGTTVTLRYKGKKNWIDVLTKYWTHSEPRSSILYTCLHTRKWSKSTSPLEILEPNSFTFGRFNTKKNLEKIKAFRGTVCQQLDHNTTHVVFQLDFPS